MDIFKHLKEPYIVNIPQENNPLSALKKIEYIGRVCYNSQDKITEDSYIKFISKLCKNGHTSVLEHGILVFTTNKGRRSVIEYLVRNKYSYSWYEDNNKYVVTNLRVLFENNLFSMEEGLHEDIANALVPDFDISKISHTFEVNTSIAISREFNRHRTISPTEMSTRYVNFDKNEYYFLKGTFYEKYENEHLKLIPYLSSLQFAIKDYKELIKEGVPPQLAREILPLDFMTKVYYTSYNHNWKHFLSLRNTTSAHPDARVIAKKISNFIIV